MLLRKLVLNNKCTYISILKRYAVTKVENVPNAGNLNFDTVYSFPFVKYFALFNRLKVYHSVGSAGILPVAGCLQLADVVPNDTFLTALYISATAASLLYLCSWPFKNIIGFIYVDKDKQNMKISYLNYWGKREDIVVATEDWTPLNELKPKLMDAIFKSPTLSNGTKFRLFVRNGIVHRPDIMGQVLE